MKTNRDDEQEKGNLVTAVTLDKGTNKLLLHVLLLSSVVLSSLIIATRIIISIQAVLYVFVYFVLYPLSFQNLWCVET